MDQLREQELEQMAMDELDMTQEVFEAADDENGEPGRSLSDESRSEDELMPEAVGALPADGVLFVQAHDDSSSALPAYLRDISSLASWTVSSHKPGCGVSALRHPDTDFFWQSDGPQPHTLNIHFFKLVSIACIRIYLDCTKDESYTPTKIVFLAGTGQHDLQVVTEKNMTDPRGWIDVDLSMAGGPDIFDELEIEESDAVRSQMLEPLINEMIDKHCVEDSSNRLEAAKVIMKGFGPSLRCFLVQVKIQENHQNGKDTHLRGLQIFARDAEMLQRFKPVATRAQPWIEEPAVGGRAVLKSPEKEALGAGLTGSNLVLRPAPWMDEPILR